MNEEGNHIVPDRTRRQAHTRERQTPFFTRQKPPRMVRQNLSKLSCMRQIASLCISDVVAIYGHCVGVCRTNLSHGNTANDSSQKSFISLWRFQCSSGYWWSKDYKSMQKTQSKLSESAGIPWKSRLNLCQRISTVNIHKKKTAIDDNPTQTEIDENMLSFQSWAVDFLDALKRTIHKILPLAHQARLQPSSFTKNSVLSHSITSV